VAEIEVESVFERTRVGQGGLLANEVGVVAEGRALELAQWKRRSPRRRGWLVRRMLVLADVAALVAAFGLVELAFGAQAYRTDTKGLTAYLFVLATLPGWIVIAKLYRLYDQDEERTHHPTTDDFSGVFHLVTVGVWLIFAGAWLTGVAHPSLPKLTVFWVVAICLLTAARTGARAWCRRRITYLQNTVIVGAGDVGQRVARKFLRHPEYGINLIGFVDSAPRPRQEGLDNVALLGSTKALPELVRLFDVERVVVAFSNDPAEETLALVRSLNDTEVQVDVVPRLFELVSPSVKIDTLEGLPLVELPPPRLARSSFAIKRALDIVGAVVGLVLTAPLFAYIAFRIRRDSAGPVFFRQTRLGLNKREFTALKFRTMRDGVDTAEHRAYIASIMNQDIAPNRNGLYKLDNAGAITPFGRWLRKTSLDELPQLINVLRGDMSLVGPRPCLTYETENFEPHHFDRFLVPAGITGLWQVTARGQATFREALDMDVAYARGWSLGLDLRLLCRTPLQALGGKATA
jgi:exopolysaccharide biosynthesis polyprenyl glycosylphosphotransferase